MGKSSEKQTTVELPPEIEKAALENLELAKRVGSLPYAPNFGLQVAGFTPQQNASFAGTNAAAGAFGMPQATGTGLPPPQNVGGFSGYSTQPLYEDAMSKVDPAVLNLYKSFFFPQAGRGGNNPSSRDVGPHRNNRMSVGGGKK